MSLDESRKVSDASTSGALPASPRAIFRSEALAHYLKHQEQPSLPPLLAPRLLLVLWILAGATLITGLVLTSPLWIGVLPQGMP